MLKVLKDTPRFLRIATVLAEKPHWGICALPFMKSTTLSLLRSASIWAFRSFDLSALISLTSELITLKGFDMVLSFVRLCVFFFRKGLQLHRVDAGLQFFLQEVHEELMLFDEELALEGVANDGDLEMVACA